MANRQFNIAKGRIVELYSRVDLNDPAASGIIAVQFSAVETDDVLQDYDDLAAILGGANTESAYTNYTRTVWTDADIALPATDDASNWREVEVPDIVIANAGLGDGPGFESIVKLVLCYAPNTAGADATFIPMTMHDISITVDESELTLTPSTGAVAFRSQ